MNRRTASSILRLIEAVRGEPVFRYLVELEQNQHTPVGLLSARREAKLAKLLIDSQTLSPFYQRRFEGLRPIEDFGSLPILSKFELRKSFSEILTPEYTHAVELCKTSGSTGEPLKFYRDRVVFGYTLASVFRAQRWYGLDIGSKQAMLWGIPAAHASRLKMRVRDLVLNRFREREYDLSPTVLQDFFAQIQRRKPEFLFGYSSMVYEFALFVATRGLDGRALGLKAAVCTAETVHPHHRSLIETTLGCPVVSEYGSAETGIISYQCPRGAHHVSDDTVYLELLDDHGNEVSDGEVGRVVVTVLHSQCAPIIRYDLGDYAVRRPGKCECGVSLSMLDRVVGRTSGVIVTPSGKCFHSIAVYYIMKEFADKFGGLRQFRIVQTHLDRLEFHVAAEQDFSESAQLWLASAIHSRFGSDMRVEFVLQASLQRSASGKLSDFESHLDAETRMIESFRQPAFDLRNGHEAS